MFQESQRNTESSFNNVTVGGNLSSTVVHVHEERLEALSPSGLEQLKAQELKALRERYCSRREIPRLFGKPLGIEKSYINLNVIETKKRDKDFKEEAESKEKDERAKSFKDERLSSFEDLFGEKRAIAVEDLFKPENDRKNSKCLLVQGRAGIGKTTFVSYVTYCWGKGSLWQGDFEWVFKITLRNLTQSSAYNSASKAHKALSMQDIIREECFPDLSPFRFEQLWREKIKGNTKVLVVLDGLDEITTITEDKEHPLHNAVQELIWGDFYLILTSRSYGLSSLPQDKKDLEIIGFTNDNITTYIQQFFDELGANKPNALVEKYKTQGKDLFDVLLFLSQQPIPIRLSNSLLQFSGPYILSA